MPTAKAPKKQSGARHSPAMKAAMKADFLAGRYRSKVELADAWQINRQVLSRWINREGWDLERQELAEAATEHAKKSLLSEWAEVNVANFKAWQALFAQILMHLKQANDAKVSLPVADIAILAGAMEKVVKGKAACYGQDPDDDDDTKVTVNNVLAIFQRDDVKAAAARYTHPFAGDAEFEEVG